MRWDDPASDPLADIRAAMKKIEDENNVPMPCGCPACDLRREVAGR